MIEIVIKFGPTWLRFSPSEWDALPEATKSELFRFIEQGKEARNNKGRA